MAEGRRICTLEICMHTRLLQQRLSAVQVLALTDCESLQSSHLAALRWLSALQSLDLSRCARLDSFMLRHVAALPALTSLSLQVRTGASAWGGSAAALCCKNQKPAGWAAPRHHQASTQRFHAHSGGRSRGCCIVGCRDANARI